MRPAGTSRRVTAAEPAVEIMPPLPHLAAEYPQTDVGGAAFRMIETLRKRADFLAAARARRQGMPAFLLQARDRGDDGPVRIGFTCSKKIGNAVMRNRAKRRLRALARQILPSAARPGWDYVLVGRPDMTVEAEFAAMAKDLSAALRKVHR